MSRITEFAIPPAPAGTAAAEISFEFFPPKTEKGELALWQTIRRLEPLRPKFVSVTYGAGGSSRSRTHRTAARIRRETDLVPAGHLTCVNATRGEVDAAARRYRDAGIRHIVALRGDAPEGTGRYAPHPGGYACASDLVDGLRKIGDFEISVAAYPEGHPDSPDPRSDIDNLKRKIDAGADRAITQFSFDADAVLRFIDRARANGITVPLVPGILPVADFAQVRKFSAACGCAIPGWMTDLFEGLDQDPSTRRLIAAAVAAEHCRILRAAGVNEFHIYTLNRADLAYAVSRLLGLRPASRGSAEHD